VPLIFDAVVCGTGVVVLLLMVIGWIVAMLALRRYRARVPYWVQRTQESQPGSSSRLLYLPAA
jgi:hypothetical protein